MQSMVVRSPDFGGFCLALIEPRRKLPSGTVVRAAKSILFPLAHLPAQVVWKVFKMPVPVGSMPQGAHGPSTLDKRTLPWSPVPEDI